MDKAQLLKLVNRICAGKSRIVDFYIRGSYNTLVLTPPSFETKMRADELYDDVLCQAIGYGLYSSDECIELAKKQQIWDDDKAARLEKIPRDVEEMKILIYQNFHKPSIVAGIRSNLRAAEETHHTLSCEKYSLEFLSSEFLARSFRYHYVLYETLYYDNGTRVFSGNYWDDNTSETLLSNLINAVNANMIDDNTYRLVVRNEPWRGMWIAGKNSHNMFGIPATLLSEEQRTAISWSRLYDSVYDAHEKPSNAIIDDNDALDGWMAFISKKQAEEAKTKEAADFTNNSRIKDAGEIYILNNKPGSAVSDLKDEDIKGINEMNDSMGKDTIKSRNKILKTQGEVLEQNLPDIKHKLRQEIARHGINSIKNRGK